MKAYARTQQDPTRDRLLAEYAPMARRIALRVARRTPNWIAADDLVSAAMVGLTEAADRYDPGRGEPFVAFATKRVRGAVLDELRRGDLLPRRVRAAARDVTQHIQALENKLGRPPDDSEVAAAMGLSIDEYREELSMLTHISVVSIDDKSAGTLEQNHEPSAISQVERKQLLAHVEAALRLLEPRDAQILSLCYIEELTYAEIGDLLGVTESRVCQIHGRALVRLRAVLQKRGIE